MLLCLAKMRFHTPQALRWYCDLTGRIQASGDFVPRIQTTWLATSDDIVLQTNQQRAGLRWYCAHGNRDLDKYKVEKVHKIWVKYGKVWESMGKYGKVWESMGKYGKVFKVQKVFFLECVAFF